MVTNITNITNIDSINSLGQFASDGTGGLFWGLILIGLFIIIVINLRNRGIDNAMMASSMGCFILSLIFLNLNWVQLLYPVAFGLIIAGIGFYKIYQGRNGY